MEKHRHVDEDGDEHSWEVLDQHDVIYCLAADEVTYDLAAAKALRNWLDAAIKELEGEKP